MRRYKTEAAGVSPRSEQECADLNALLLMATYLEAELKKVAPGSAVFAGFLRNAVENELVMRTFRNAASEIEVH